MVKVRGPRGKLMLLAAGVWKHKVLWSNCTSIRTTGLCFPDVVWLFLVKWGSSEEVKKKPLQDHGDLSTSRGAGWRRTFTHQLILQVHVRVLLFLYFYWSVECEYFGHVDQQILKGEKRRTLNCSPAVTAEEVKLSGRREECEEQWGVKLWAAITPKYYYTNHNTIKYSVCLSKKPRGHTKWVLSGHQTLSSN